MKTEYEDWSFKSKEFIIGISLFPILFLIGFAHIGYAEVERYEIEDNYFNKIETAITETGVQNGLICFEGAIGGELSECIKCNWFIIYANRHDPEFREQYFSATDLVIPSDKPFFRERALNIYNEACQWMKVKPNWV